MVMTFELSNETLLNPVKAGAKERSQTFTAHFKQNNVNGPIWICKQT